MSKTDGKAEKMFSDFGKKIDQLMEEMNEGKGNIKEEYESRLEELKRNFNSLKEEFVHVKDFSKERWHEIEEGFEKAANEIGNASQKKAIRPFTSSTSKRTS